MSRMRRVKQNYPNYIDPESKKRILMTTEPAGTPSTVQKVHWVEREIEHDHVRNKSGVETTRAPIWVNESINKWMERLMDQWIDGWIVDRKDISYVHNLENR